MKSVRSRRAQEVVGQEPSPFSVHALAGHRYILLVTTRRDGREVATPMWFAADGDERLVVRSGAGDPKLKRIRNNPDVKIAACDLRGRPLGPPMKAQARILPRDAEDRAELLLKRALGWQRSLYSFFRAPVLDMVYLEITHGMGFPRPTEQR